MHCCNINKSRMGDFFWFTWYKNIRSFALNTLDAEISKQMEE